ncbi:hypothetical protein AB0N31_18005 [Streptomyces sp. NPDC051051]|uniref:hypothetical protein n=1 Tax=Streptomyces sp. NPDC051051 TaxID=3155666 RepID=UPI003414F5B2
MSAAAYLIDTSALVRVLKQPARALWEKPPNDFETIASVTGRSTQWLAAPGSL